MKIYSYEQARDDLDRILSREGDPGEGVGGIVSDIITDVRRRGDAALVDYTKKFDGAEIDSLRVTPEEIAEARAQLGPELLTAYEDAEKYIGRKADKNRKIYNGMMKTYFYQFMGPKPPRRSADEKERN